MTRRLTKEERERYYILATAYHGHPKFIDAMKELEGKDAEIADLKAQLAPYREQEIPGIEACMRLNAKLRDRIADMTKPPEVKDWEAFVIAASKTDDPALGILRITAEYNRMRDRITELEACQWRPIAEMHEDDGECLAVNLYGDNGFHLVHVHVCDDDFDVVDWTHFQRINLSTEDAERLIAEMKAAEVAKEGQ